MDINAVRNRVSQLENAIKRLDSVKKHLSRSATDVKAEIRANVSRNLEFLRGREVSLLSEVDQVMGVKEDTLHMQQARLNQALGVLQTSLSMVQDDSATERQLLETLDKLNRLELSPEETPHITFRGDHIGLRETILNYGRVDANGLPLITAFNDPGHPSASLPRQVEEYEDQDHHVFYKTVEEVRRGKSETSSSITVTIPKLSTRVEDWLQKKTALPASKVSEFAPSRSKLSPVVAPKRPNTLTKLGEKPSPVHSLSRTSTPGSTCSLNNWLSIIKQHADLEEEHNFEIVDNSVLQKAPARAVSSFANSKFEVQKDLQRWLRPVVTSAANSDKDFFKHISNNKQVWLLQTQLRSLEEVKQPDFFHHISKEPSTWLRSRASGRLDGDRNGHEHGDFFSHIPKSTDLWLNKKNLPSKDEEKNPCCRGSTCGDDGMWLLKTKPASTPPFELEDVCRANELCGSFSECVSQPECFAMKIMDTSPVKNPLDPTKVFKPLDLPEQEWLHATRRPKQLVDEEEMECQLTETLSTDANDVFHIIPGVEDPVWLSKPVSSIDEHALLFSNHKGDKDETNMWLQKVKPEHVRNESKSSVTSFSSVGGVSCFSTSSELLDWLLVPAKKEDHGEKKVEALLYGEEKESEGWSVVPENYSVSSDQQEIDVAAADSYIKKWLM